MTYGRNLSHQPREDMRLPCLIPECQEWAEPGSSYCAEHRAKLRKALVERESEW